MEQPPSDPPKSRASTPDAVAATLALAWGIWNVASLLPARNPRLLPYAQDSWEYLGFTRHLLDPWSGAPSAYRYPLFPWLSSLFCSLTGEAPYLGNLWVALAAAALLPLALYLLGRQLAPAFLALGGSLLGTSLPILTLFLGQVSDYLFCTCVQILSAAAALWALRRGGVASFAAAGLAMAAFMAATPKALTWMLAALALLALRALLGVRSRPRQAALELVGLLLPLLLVWWWFAQAGLVFNSLEHATDLVFSDWLGAPPVTSVHPNPGALWPPTQGWVIGQSGAVATLPSTLHYLREVASQARAHGSVDAALSLLHREIPLGLGGCLLALAGLGALGPVLRQHRSPRWPGAFAAALLAALLLASQLLASGSLPDESRYHLTTLLILPVFCVTGAWAIIVLIPPIRRANPWLWGIPALACLWAVEGSAWPIGRLAHIQAASVVARLEAVEMSPFAELVSLRPQLEPDDLVLDFTPDGKGSSVLLGVVGIERHPGYVRDGRVVPLTLLPFSGARRLLIGPCAGREDPGQRRWVVTEHGSATDEPRLTRLSPCVLEDTRPQITGILSWE